MKAKTIPAKKQRGSDLQWETLAILFAVLVALCWVAWLLLSAVYDSSGWTGALALVAALSAGFGVWQWRRQAPARARAERRGAAAMAGEAGDWEGAEKILTELLKEQADGGDLSGRAGIHWELLSLYRKMKRPAEAAGQARAAMAASEGLSGSEEKQIAEEAPLVLIELLTRMEKWGELEEFVQERLAKAKGTLAVELRLEAAATSQRQGKRTESLEHLRVAVSTAQQLEDSRQELLTRSLQALGAAALEAENYPEAAEAFGALSEYAQSLPENDAERSKWHLLGALGLGQTWLAEGNAAATAALWHDVVEECGPSVSEELRAKSLYMLAGALLEAGHFRPARRRAREALKMWEQNDELQAEGARKLLDAIALQEALSGASEATESSTEE